MWLGTREPRFLPEKGHCRAGRGGGQQWKLLLLRRSSQEPGPVYRESADPAHQSWHHFSVCRVWVEPIAAQREGPSPGNAGLAPAPLALGRCALTGRGWGVPARPCSDASPGSHRVPCLLSLH